MLMTSRNAGFVTESVAAMAATSRVDEENFVVRRVKVIGLSSVNNRKYPANVIRAASTLYENAPVYIDHVKPGASRTSSYGESVGMLKNFTTTDQGGFADLYLNPGHPRAKQVIWDAKNRPQSFGLSHHADIEMDRFDHKTVTKIDHVYSVDIVKNPATNKGLFEAVTEDMVDIDVPAERLAKKGGDAAREFLVKVRAAFTKPGYTVDQAMKEVARLVDEFEATIGGPAEEAVKPITFRDNADRLHYLRTGQRKPVKENARNLINYLRGNSPTYKPQSVTENGATETADERRRKLITFLRSR